MFHEFRILNAHSRLKGYCGISVLRIIHFIRVTSYSLPVLCVKALLKIENNNSYENITAVNSRHIHTALK